MNSYSELETALRKIARISAVSVFSLGVTVLVGWLFDLAILKSISLGWVSMKANTAIGFVLCGSSLWLSAAHNRRILAATLAAFACLIGVFTVLEYILVTDLGIDQIFFRDALNANATSSPGRMGSNTALLFVLLGLALFTGALEFRRKTSVLRILVIPALVISFSAFLAYLFGVSTLAGFGAHTRMAVHTSFGMIILSIGALALCKDQGMLSLFYGDSLGSVYLRKMAPMIIGTPLILGWLRLEGERLGLYSSDVGVVMVITLTIAILLFFKIQSVKLINQKEEAIREQGLLFQLVLDCIGDGVVVADTKGKFLIVNPAADKMVGIGTAEVPTFEWAKKYSVYYPDGKTLFATDELPMVQALQGRAVDNVEQLLKGPQNPQGRFISVSARPLVTNRGEQKGGVVIFRDVGVLREAQEKLKHSEATFQGLFESAPDAIVGVDKSGTIVRVNSQVEALFDYSRDEILGKAVEILLPERFRDRHVGHRTSYSANPRTRAVTGAELVGRKKDGTEFPVAISLGPLKIAEETLVLAVVRDVSEAKRAENKIIQLNLDLKKGVEDLKLVNKELESFSYSVAHDLRAPLRSMMGFSNILLEDFGDSLDKDARGNLMRVVGAAQKMGQLIDGLLDLSRLTRKEIAKQPVNLSALAKNIATDLQNSQPDRKVNFLITDDILVQGDPLLLKLALTNLLGNAWKYTAKLTGEAEIEFGTTEEQGKTAFFVRDNGAGFDMKFSDKLFGVFQRLHSVKEFDGIGIGLATVQRIIHRHGGEIWAVASPEKGAAFYFTI